MRFFFFALASTLSLTVFGSPSITFSSKKINPELVKQLIDVYGCDSFIETGTYLGKTPLALQSYFKSIHTIELSERLFKSSKDKLSQFKNIHCYLGDSANMLPIILEQTASDNVMIFLDAHWSGGTATARGEDNTPILRELKAIQNHLPKKFVIIIDDVREFCGFPNKRRYYCLGGYPSIQQLRKRLQLIAPDHDFFINGDLALVVPKNVAHPFSEVIQAATYGRIHTANAADLEGLQTLLQWDATIRQSANTEDGQEMLNLSQLYNVPHFSQRRVFHQFWAGLVNWGRNNLKDAHANFSFCIKHGFPDWRAHQYRAEVLALLGRTVEAQRDLQVVAKIKTRQKNQS